MKLGWPQSWNDTLYKR